VAVDPGAGDSVHAPLAGLNEPAAGPFENVTVPAGLPFVPEPVSVTVTAQVVASFTATVDCEHVTLVDVARVVTLT